ncbi:host specificity factor TipJ family phage tail protein [Tropicimonas sp. S265A]|uniref:host specificity factor TipJ family phage tail protein n=1 Tax=Tropicimonas sp. S265A TaxID=3415134 RepID=UPI003C7BA22A
MTRLTTPALRDPDHVIDDLIGLPWLELAAGPEAFDCWGLVVHFHREVFGRSLPLSDSFVDDGNSLREIMMAIRANHLWQSWVPVEMPAHGDIVLMAQGHAFNHIGVFVETPARSGILHACEGEGVALDCLAQVTARYNRVIFVRYAEGALSSLRDVTAPSMVPPGKALAVCVTDALNPLLNASIQEVEPGQTVAEVLVGMPPRPGTWVVLNKVPLLRKHPVSGNNEYLREIMAGDVLWVLPALPLGGGGGGSRVLASVLSIVAVLAAPFIAGFIAPGLAAGSFGAKLLTAGIAVGSQALISTFVPKPAVIAPLAQPDPTYSFSRFGNQLRPGAQVPRPYGTIKREPDLLTTPWAEYASNEQLAHVLLHAGSGAQEVLEFGFDDTPVWTSTAGYTGVVQSVVHQVAQPGQRITLFPTAVEVSSEVEGIELPEPVGGTPVAIGPFAAVAAGERATEIVIDLVFPSGLFSVNEAGLQPASVRWLIDIQRIDDSGAPLGPVLNFENRLYANATATQIRLTRRFAVEAGRYQVSVTRFSASTATGSGAQDSLFWASLRAKRADQDPYTHDTALAIRVQADAVSSRSITNWYVKTRAVLPHFNVSTGELVTGPTEQIDAAALHIARGEHGLALPDNRIDLPALKRLAQTWNARGDVCCTVLEAEMTAWEALEMVLAAGRAKPVFQKGMLTFVRDEATPPTRVITHADMVRGSFEVERVHFKRESPSAVRMVYRDRDGQMQSLICPAGAPAASAAEVRTQVMVDRGQVWREGSYLAASSNTRRRFPSWVGLPGAKSYLPGQTVSVSHPRPNYGRPARVVALHGLTMTLSAAHGLAEGEAGWLSLVRRDGSPWGPVRVLPGDTAVSVIIDGADFDNILSGIGDDLYDLDFRTWLISEEMATVEQDAEFMAGQQAEPTRAVVGTDASRMLTCKIVGTTPQAGGRVEVLAVEDDPSVHTADQAPVPPAATGALPIGNSNGIPWEGVSVVGIERAGGGVFDFTVSGPAYPAAVGYLVETSPDTVPQVWTEVGSANTPLISQPENISENILVRAAIRFDVLRGQWTTFRIDLATAEGGVVTAKEL